MKRLVLATVLLTCTLVGAGTASAAPLTLNCPGGLQAAPINFGGSGIPNDAICTAQFQGVVLAMTAHQRFDNPALTNLGNGTFFAGTGDDTAHGAPTYAIWNFAFYAYNSTGTALNVDLRWDTNPGVSTDETLAGHLYQTLAPLQLWQDSWNLGMDFIDTGLAVPPFYSPAAGPFNPYLGGQYSFDLRVFREQTLFGAVGINVVTSAVPEPASFLLLGAGLAGLAVRLRRRRKA